MKRYVIVGNGVAAVGCVEGIRSVTQEGEIVVVSGEDRPVYCRPLISYYLENKTTLEKMNYREPDFYEKNGAKVLYGRKGLKIDAQKKILTLDDGSELSYDALCVATGSSPFVPPFEGLDTVEKKTPFMTIDDMLALESFITPESRVLIVGAGLIGLKCAEGICDRVKSTVVCDLSTRVLSSILDDECAALMQAKLEEHGVEFLLGDSAVRFEGAKAFMKSGKTVEFDALVLAVGVRANSLMVRDAGGEIDRGVLVDVGMRTSLPDVYAAGDCAQGDDQSIGAKRVLAILPNAYMQGHTAGANMAGGSEAFSKAIPMNSIGFFGLHAMTAGAYDGEMYEEKSEGKIKRLFTKNGRLIGFILIGETERAGIYVSLIREKTPLDSLDFEMLKKVATSAAFSKATRKHKFAEEPSDTLLYVE